MQLERQARLPLRVGHLEEVNLRNRAGDVEKRVDSAEQCESLIDDALRRLRLGEIALDHERFCARGHNRFRRALEVRPVPRDKNERREIARKANGCRSANP
jgi:hypothetical protein